MVPSRIKCELGEATSPRGEHIWMAREGHGPGCWDCNRRRGAYSQCHNLTSAARRAPFPSEHTMSFFFQARCGTRDVHETGVQWFFFFFQAEDGIRDIGVTGVQTCALPI